MTPGPLVFIAIEVKTLIKIYIYSTCTLIMKIDTDNELLVLSFNFKENEYILDLDPRGTGV